MRRTCTAVMVATALAWTVMAPGAHAAQRVPVSGDWQSLVNCVFTSYDALTGRMTGVGSTLWTGDLRGTTKYDVNGSYDVVSGNSEGTLHEVFHGADVAGNRGSITFEETYRIDGATSTIHIDVTVVGGTGDFSSARGTMAFDGTDNAATGFGTYRGVLDLRRSGR